MGGRGQTTNYTTEINSKYLIVKKREEYIKKRCI